MVVDCCGKSFLWKENRHKNGSSCCHFFFLQTKNYHLTLQGPIVRSWSAGFTWNLNALLYNSAISGLSLNCKNWKPKQKQLSVRPQKSHAKNTSWKKTRGALVGTSTIIVCIFTWRFKGFSALWLPKASEPPGPSPKVTVLYFGCRFLSSNIHMYHMFCTIPCTVLYIIVFCWPKLTFFYEGSIDCYVRHACTRFPIWTCKGSASQTARTPLEAAAWLFKINREVKRFICFFSKPCKVENHFSVSTKLGIFWLVSACLMGEFRVAVASEASLDSQHDVMICYNQVHVWSKSHSLWDQTWLMNVY